RPQPNSGEPAYRWNWDTPLIMSPHDPKVIFAAANKVFRSSNRGLNWESSGTDLTSNANRDDIVTMGVKGSDIRISKNDGIQTWQSASGNLKGEVIKTLTEDQKNQDVLYVGAETGLFVSTDRAKSWTRIKANLPTVRIDEITLHPRDNAMILATHGRAIWILD